MAEGTQVGKISLGVDFEGLEEKLKQLSKDLGDKLGNLGGVDFDKVTEALDKSLKSISESFQANMEKVSTNISRTLTDALDAVKKKAESIEISMPKVKAEDLPGNETVTAPANRSNAPPSVTPSRTSTDPLGTAQANLELVARQMDMLGAKADTARDKVKQIEAEIQRLSTPTGNGIEDSINLKAIDNLKIQLDKANEAYDAHVLKVDKAAAQYGLLEDAIKRIEATQAEKAAEKAKKLADEAEKAANKMKKASEQSAKLGQNTGALGKVSDGVGQKFNKLGKMITSALKRVLIMATLYKIIRGFMSYMNSALKTNDQFAGSLAQIKSNLQIAFMPIFQAILPALNALMAGLARATSYLAAFISAIFGKTYSQSAESAKALNKQKDAIAGVGGSAKKSKKELDLMLAGFDEITNLSTPSADDAGGGGSASAPIITPPDTAEIESKIGKVIDNMKQKFKEIWDSEPVQAFAGVIESRFNFMKNFAKETFTNIKNHAVDTINKIAPDIQGGLDNVSQLMTDVFNDYSSFLDTWGPRFTEKVNGIFSSIWTDVIDPAAQIIAGIFNDLTENIKNLWAEKGQATLDNIGLFVTNTLDLFQSLWDNIIAPIIEPMMKEFEELWNDHLKDTITNVIDFVILLYNAAMDIYNKFIVPVLKWFSEKLKPIIEFVMTGLADFFSENIGGIIDTVNGIIDTLKGVINFVAGVFTGDWKRAWDGIKQIFQGVWDTLGSIVKTPINLMISALNTLITGLNKIDIKVPDWVPVLGGKGIDINIPTIPKLARGGVVDQPTLAMIGETRRKEAVLPLEGPNMGWMKQMAKELVTEMGGSSQGGGDVIINLDGREIARAAKNGINEERRMQGLPVL